MFVFLFISPCSVLVVALQWSEKKKKGSMAGQEGSFMAVRRIQHGIDRGRGFHSSPGT